MTTADSAPLHFRENHLKGRRDRRHQPHAARVPRTGALSRARRRMAKPNARYHRIPSTNWTWDTCYDHIDAIYAVDAAIYGGIVLIFAGVSGGFAAQIAALFGDEIVATQKKFIKEEVSRIITSCNEVQPAIRRRAR
eukprot:3771117-Rhodomonas_salina.2